MDIEVSLLEPETDTLLAYARGTGQYMMRSYIATTGSSEKIYKKAMSVAIYKAMEFLSGLVPQL